MPDKKNAEIFIDSYNKIDAQLRELYGFKPQQSFTVVERRSAEKNTVVRRYKNELTDYARLRNAIVHQSTDGRVIAVPCDDVVEDILRIERQLCTPPTVGEKLREKQVTSIDAAISLRQAVLLIARTGYSNLPVYEGKRMVGILNNRRIIKALGEVLREGGSADAFLSQTAAGEVVEPSDLFVYYRYVGKQDSLQSVLDAFESNKKLLAVCVSETGRAGERIVNFITPADLAAIHRMLEDY